LNRHHIYQYEFIYAPSFFASLIVLYDFNIYFILLLLIPLWLSFGLRTTSLTAPLLQDHASNYVHNAIYNDIESQVQAQYPLLPLDMLKEQTQEAYNDVIATNKPNVDGQIELVYQSLLSNIQDDQGQTYLSAIDPYFWFKIH